MTRLSPSLLPDWPYPRWIAHRGAGKLAPENTLAAFRVGAAQGYRMFECDVKLSADGIPFLLHDADLQRTTNAVDRLGLDAQALPGQQSWRDLSQLDAGGWHSRGYVGEPMPTLEAIAHYCLRNGFFLNIEIKATPGAELETGKVVAQHVAKWWPQDKVPPLLTSFDAESLVGAREAQPQLPRGFLMDALEGRAWAQWVQQAQSLGCCAMVCNYLLWDAQTVESAHAAGLRTLSYTVNDAAAAQKLWDLHTDGIITDRVDGFSPAA